MNLIFVNNNSHYPSNRLKKKEDCVLTYILCKGETAKIEEIANSLISNTTFDIDLSSLSKDHYRQIKQQLVSVPLEKIKSLQTLCRGLLNNQVVKQKNSIKQRLTAIFIACQIIKNHNPSVIGAFSKPLIDYIKKFSPIDFIDLINRTLQYAHQEKIGEMKRSLAAYTLLNVCFKLIEEKNALYDLSLGNFLFYCEARGEKIKILELKEQEHIKNLRKIISYCPNLQELNLKDVSINLEDLKGLSLFELKKLSFNSCKLNSNRKTTLIFKDIAPNLEELNLESTWILSLEGLRGLSKLEKFNLSWSSIPNEEFLKINAICPHLKELNLEMTQIKSIEGLKGLFKLERLNLQGCKLSDKDFLEIKNMFPAIKELIEC